MSVNTDIYALRKVINQLDETIIASIAKRHEVSRQIGIYKEQQGIVVYDKKREDELHVYYASLSKKYGVDKDFVIEIFDLIIQQSRNIQKKKE